MVWGNDCRLSLPQHLSVDLRAYNQVWSGIIILRYIKIFGTSGGSRVSLALRRRTEDAAAQYIWERTEIILVWRVLCC